MKKIGLMAVAVSVLLSACGTSMLYQKDPALYQKIADSKVNYPNASFAVISDTHYYDNSLGTTGADFQDYIDNDRKMLTLSEQILTQAVTQLSEKKLDFVIVCGDLTKDGEFITHLKMSNFFAQLEKSGKKVYVINGNHDLNNANAYDYTGDKKKTIPSVQPANFVKIYGEFGYNEAIRRDTNSLSYLAEPVPGLCILALDACRYRENKADEEPIVDGKYSPATLVWIETTLAWARENNKAVIGMEHHGIIEHYVGQNNAYGEYILDDYKSVGQMYAFYKMSLVFTGHYHAQDVTKATYSENGKTTFLFDIETGSMATYPCPYRIVNILSNNEAVISTEFVSTISSMPTNFVMYAQTYLHEGLTKMAIKALKKFGVPENEAKILGPQISAAFAAHYYGDEVKPAKPIDNTGLGLMANIVLMNQGAFLTELYNDLPPKDKFLQIDLNTGEYK